MLQGFVKAYNFTVHTILGMTPAAVTDKHVLDIRPNINDTRSRVRVGRDKYNVRQHVTSVRKNEIRKGVGTQLY